jgi:hypothetical protein
MRRILTWLAATGLAFPSITSAACALKQNEAGEYLIANYEDFLLMGQGGCTLTATDNYRVTASFSAAASATRVNGTGMGLGQLPHFYGKLRGGGHTISDLTIHQPTVDDVGLFASLRETGLIDSLELANVSVLGRVRVGVFAANNFGTLRAVRSTGTLTAECAEANPIYGGGLVAYNTGLATNGWLPGTIENSSSAVTVTANGASASAGGLVSFNTHRGQISGSYATGSVTAHANSGRGYVGGIAGENWGLIEKSYATGQVSGKNSSYTGHALHVGGLVGRNVPESGTEPSIADRGTIRQCWASGNVEGISAIANPSTNYTVSMDVGGLAGFSSGTIRNSYASGSVAMSGEHAAAYWYAGSLVGNNYSTAALINNAYALGQVTAQYTGASAPKLGGLVGSNQGTVQNVFWPDSSTLGSACHTNSGAAVCTATRLTVDQFKNQATFPTFDFTQIWTLGTGASSPLLQALLKPLTIYPVSVTRTYDGTAFSGHGGIASIPALTDLGAYLAGTPVVSGNSQGAVDAGTYALEVSGYSSIRQDGYLLSYRPGTLTIEPKSLALTGLTAAGKTYDGTTAAVLAGTPALGVADIVDGDAVALGACSATGQFQDKNAGKDKPVSLTSCVLTGADAANYALKTQLAATISSKTIPVVADSTGKKAGAADPELTYKLGTPLYTGDVLSGKLSRTAGEKVGPYEIQLGTLSGAPNYMLEFTKAPFVIVPAPVPALALEFNAPAEFRYAGGSLWFRGVRGEVQVYNIQARLVGAFQAQGNGGVALALPAGRYWVRSATLGYTFQVD